MSIQVKQSLCEATHKLIKDNFLHRHGSLSVRQGRIIYITPIFRDPSAIQEEDIIEIDKNTGQILNKKLFSPAAKYHLAIYKNRKDISAIIHTSAPATMAMSYTGEVVKPLLDDMAQIVGTSIQQTQAKTTPKNLSILLKKLKRRNTVFLEEQGALCCAGSLDDAHAVCQVTEKACQAWIESSFIGGGHAINKFEALLMRWVYLKKYSKKNNTNT